MSGRSSSRASFLVDPADPRAPSLEVWHSLSQQQQAEVLAALPSEIEKALPEGDRHRIPKQRGLEALSNYFQRRQRNVYLSSELPVYYPAERMFAPDLIAVLDVEPGERDHWTVAHEGRGLDFVLEVTLQGSRKKDLEENVERFARLEIPEYFVFERGRSKMHGFRLLREQRRYEAVVPQEGRWRSLVLDLDLTVEADRVRFYAGSAVLPEAAELVTRANSLVETAQSRADVLEQQLAAAIARADLECAAKEEALRAREEALRAREQEQRAREQEQRAREQEQRAREQEQRAREQAEERLRELELELERLKRQSTD